VSRARLVALLVIAAVAAVMLAAALPDTILAGDAVNYRDRMTELFSGRIPYFQFPFEHLPGAIVPLAAAWLLGGFAGLSQYAFALAAVSAITLIITLLLLARIGDRLGQPRLTVRWLVLVAPLLPFLLFRNDSFPVLLGVAAFLAGTAGRASAASGLAGGGVVSKFWPVSWAAIDWWQGRKRAALALAVLGVLCLVLLRLPPVMEIQRPTGVHSETVIGSLLGLTRAATGQPLQIERTSAAYVEAPWWALAGNVIVGGVLALMALAALRSPFSWERAWPLVGAVTGAIMLASPLLSTQYVAWLAPFAAGERRSWRLALLVNLLSLVLIITWFDLFEGRLWWWSVLAGRNLLLIVLVALLARAAASRPAPAGRLKEG
jgi:hypothetical protein